MKRCPTAWEILYEIKMANLFIIPDTSEGKREETFPLHRL